MVTMGSRRVYKGNIIFSWGKNGIIFLKAVSCIAGYEYPWEGSEARPPAIGSHRVNNPRLLLCGRVYRLMTSLLSPAARHETACAGTLPSIRTSVNWLQLFQSSVVDKITTAIDKNNNSMLITTLAMTTTTTNRIKIKFIFTTIVIMHFIYLKQTRAPDTNIPLFFHILPVARWYKRLILLKMLLFCFFSHCLFTVLSFV